MILVLDLVWIWHYSCTEHFKPICGLRIHLFYSFVFVRNNKNKNKNLGYLLVLSKLTFILK